MFIESTFLPLPSELIIPPAALSRVYERRHEFARNRSRRSVWLLARRDHHVLDFPLGRPPAGVEVSANIFFISPEKIEKAERWASNYGNFGIFASRLLPVVRHLIGIPAGIVQMNYARFSLYTLLGSSLWCGVLCWLGVKAGQDEALMNGELHAITLWAVGVLAVLGVVYYLFVHRQMQATKK